jgi:hypothetical protein
VFWIWLIERSGANCRRPFHFRCADNSAKLFGFIEDTPWAASLKLVPMTAEGLALPGFNYALLQTMSPLQVETWADFSTRLVRRAQPGGVLHRVQRRRAG